MLNYTVTSQAFLEDAGDQVNLATPTVLLKITADPDYTVAAADFTVGEALPTEVTSVAFVDALDGTIDCTVTFAAGFIMPFNDVNLPIDIDGTARILKNTILGSVVATGLNIQTSPYYYTRTLELGASADIFSGTGFTITADAEHYFKDTPSLSKSGTAYPDDYAIVASNTLDGDGRLIQVDYAVTYTNRSGQDALEESITIYADAEQFLVVTTPKYYSYRPDFGAGAPSALGDYTLNEDATQLLLTVYGDIGAKVTVDLSKDGGLATNVVTDQIITFMGGYTKIAIDLPGEADSTTWAVLLSGDIDLAFAQPNPIQINIQTNISYTLVAAAIAGYTITPRGTLSVAGLSGPVLPGATATTTIKGAFIITKDDGAVIQLKLNPTWGTNIDNLDPTTNGGTQLLYSNSVGVSGNGTTSLYISVSATVTAFGLADVISTLTLAADINSIPITTDISTAAQTAALPLLGTLGIPLTTFVSDADGDTLTPIIITQPANGTVVVDGFGFSYTHTNEAFLADAFTYAVTDGYNQSNVSTSSMLVTGEAPTPASGTVGIFRMNIEVGATASNIEVDFSSTSGPQRVELLYKGLGFAPVIVVADSMFVGIDLSGAGRAGAIKVIEDQIFLTQFTHVGSGGNGPLYGQTAAWDSYKPPATVDYDATEAAPTGTLRSVQANSGAQFGLLPDANDSASGNFKINFTKPVGGSTIVTVRISAVTGSTWNINSITVTP
tara:strand:+ start:19289 stop:21463 length:2175 start_codon:yes stop_codon:yes gene_type:complete